jgi:two-component system, NtrC family, nitrogen regulation sensor histidine kinase NtrY
MVFNNYHFQILLRLVMIVLNVCIAVYVFTLDEYWVTFGNLCALVVIQVVLLFRYLTRWQKDVAVVANAVKHGDYSFHFNLADPKHPLFNLYHTINRLSRHVSEVETEAERQSQYFTYILNNSQVGLLIYDGQGNVLLVNQEFKALTGDGSLDHIDDLKSNNEVLLATLQSMPLNRPHLLLNSANSATKLSVRLSKIVVREQPIFIVSLINIKPELDENELQSWQDLMSVLTHEIMNSVAPIHSLNGTMAKYLDKIEGNAELVTKAKSNLEVINRRSEALMNFVERYRSISTVPLPRLQPMLIKDLFFSVTELLADYLKGIDVIVDVANETISVDRAMIEQVLINLVKNAIFALEGCENPRLILKVKSSNEETMIMLEDNGKGIDPAVAGKIFMPFFTTRPSGSGIGLTVSRQIMQRHKGTIHASSVPGGGSIFTLTFPK